MSKPKLERNRAIVKLRKKDPKIWTFRALAKEFGFKTPSTVKEIYDVFVHKV